MPNHCGLLWLVDLLSGCCQVVVKEEALKRE
jgi:hypothetical protein